MELTELAKTNGHSATVSLQPYLKPEHQQYFLDRGVSPEIIALNVSTITDPKVIASALRRKHPSSEFEAGFLIKGVNPHTGKPRIDGSQFRLDKPRQQKDSDGTPVWNADGSPKIRKFENPVGTAYPLFLAMPESDYWAKVLAAPTRPVWITEGAAKAGAIITREDAAVSVPGVCNGQKFDRLHKELKELAQDGRPLYLAFDADWRTNANVRKALEKLGNLLRNAGAIVYVARWSGELGKGIDDYLVASGASLEDLKVDALTFKEWLEEAKQIDATAPQPQKKCKMLQLKDEIELAVNGQLKLNLLGLQLEYQGQPVKASRYKLFLAQLLNQDVSREDAAELLGAIGEANAYHPVKEYLESVYQEYGDSTVNLLDAPATRLLGTSDSLYDVFLRNRLIGSVARIFEPGCHLDEITVLKGKQGLGKSRFWEYLFGREFFSNSMGSDLHNKDELMKLYMTWGMELDELDRVTSYKEAGVIKSFASRADDVFRAPYERSPEKHLRQCSLVATVNEDEFLSDTTGNRRFQVIPVESRIDRAQVQAERDQLWAAAVHLYKSGQQWHLTPEQEVLAAAYTAQYERTDLWENTIAAYLEQPENWIYKGDIPHVLPDRILINALKFDVSRIGHAEKKRLSQILRKLGWEPANNSKAIWIGGRTQRAWMLIEKNLLESGEAENLTVDGTVREPLGQPLGASNPCTATTLENLTVHYSKLEKNLESNCVGEGDVEGISFDKDLAGNLQNGTVRTVRNPENLDTTASQHLTVDLTVDLTVVEPLGEKPAKASTEPYPFTPGQRVKRSDRVGTPWVDVVKQSPEDPNKTIVVDGDGNEHTIGTAYLIASKKAPEKLPKSGENKRPSDCKAKDNGSETLTSLD